MTEIIEKGDRVRVTFEAEVIAIPDTDVTEGFEVSVDTPIGNGRLAPTYHWFGPRFIKASGLTVEKAEPPVEVFGPGDVVRRWDGRTYFLYEHGYSRLWEADKPFAHYGTGYTKEFFTSDNFERVSLD